MSTCNEVFFQEIHFACNEAPVLVNIYFLFYRGSKKLSTRIADLSMLERSRDCWFKFSSVHYKVEYLYECIFCMYIWFENLYFYFNSSFAYKKNISMILKFSSHTFTFTLIKEIPYTFLIYISIFN